MCAVKTMTSNGKVYWYGQEVSEYGAEHSKIGYRCLGNVVGDCIECSQLMYNLYGDYELINGEDYDDEYDEYYEIFNYFLINRNGVEILSKYTDEIVYYIPEFDLYVWGITHWGTSWDYVLTDIKIENNNATIG